MWYYRLIARLTPNSQIQTLLDLLYDVQELGEYILDNSDTFLRALGHEVRKTYVIFTQNTGETRPTGGFLGSYITVEVVKGELEINDSKSIYLLDDNKPTPIVTHPFISYLSLDPNGKGFEAGLRNLNYFNCFETTANMIQRELNNLDELSIDSDGIVFINTDLLVDLLPDNFAINIPEFGAFNSTNILYELDRITSLEPVSLDPGNVKGALSPVFQYLLQSLPAIVQEVGIGNFLRRLIQSVQAQNFMIWFKDSFLQEFFAEFGFDGGQTCANTNAISPLHINLTADKRDSITTNRYAINAQPVWGGYRISVQYQQIVPPGAFLPRGFNELTARHYFGLQVPEGSWNFAVESPSVFDREGVDDFYFLHLRERYGQDYHVPEEYQLLYNSITNFDNGYTYLQPDGTRVVGGVMQTNQEISTMTISFNVPQRMFENLEFIGQPGINDPEVSLGKNLRYTSARERVYRDRFAIQKGLDIQII